MARSQFNFIVAIPDSGTGVLSVITGASVEVLTRTAAGADGTAPKVYVSDQGPSGSTGTLFSDSQGRVSGFLEDGRYRAKVSGAGVTNPFQTDFDLHSGGAVKVAKDGNPVDDGANSQIELADDTAGENPALLFGPGDDVPDVAITRTDNDELTFDTIIPGDLSTRINGDVRLSDKDSVLSVNGARVQDGATPLSSTDLATKAYVDATNSQVDNSTYKGSFHNLPITMNMAGDIGITNGVTYFSKVNIPVGTSVSEISFVRGTGTSSNLVQFGIFGEFVDESSYHKMICLAATEHDGASWSASTQKSLRMGFYDDSDVFMPLSYYYGPYINFYPTAGPDPEPVFTGNLYAGILANGSVNLTGANITSPIVTMDLGLPVEDQFPLFAGVTVNSLAITTSVYLIGGETDPTELAFPANRSATKVPFVRLKV